jgi:RecB family exonuclease
LLAGAAEERTQLVRQMELAMRDLHRYLRKTGFTIAAVEEVIETPCAIGTLRGRLDVRLVDRDGNSAVLDLKWGRSSYQTRLEEGRAVQLAAYARAIAQANDHTSLPPAAYYAISRGQVMAADPRMQPTRAVDGPTLAETWSRVEATATAVLEAHTKGQVFVSSTRRALPLLDALGIPKDAQDKHFSTERETPCEHCSYGTICGRKWEVFS